MEKYFLRSKAAISRADAHEPFRGISVCIMDEASQCVEPEALIPLKFGFNKVIMVRYLNMYLPTYGRVADPVPYFLSDLDPEIFHRIQFQFPQSKT